MLEDIDKKLRSARFSENTLTHHVRAADRMQWIEISPHTHLNSPRNSSWARSAIEESVAHRRMLEWVVESTVIGTAMLYDCVTVDPEVRGGQPVLKGTRFTVAQVLVELSDSSGVTEVAYDFKLSADDIRKFLRAFSLLLERSGQP